MTNRRTFLRRRGAAIAILPLLVLSMAFAADRPAGRGREVVEIPMQVQAEGPTHGEHLQRQADLHRWLAGALPAAALGDPLRADLTQEEILALERAPHVSGTPLRVGLVKPVSPRFDLDGLRVAPAGGAAQRGPGGIATPAGDGGSIWGLAVLSAGAGAIRVHIEQMSLPPGVDLYLYSRMGEAFGPYRGGGPHGDGDFWADTLFGREAILQIRVSRAVEPADLQRITLSVTEAGIVLPRFAGTFTPLAPAFCGNPDCIVDASCFGGTPADAAKNAVAKMEWVQGAFIYTCTGGLIADTHPSQGNFFLTANHCVSKNNTAGNVQFYWQFRTSSCNGSCPSNAGWPLKTMGATVSATGRKGDFTLLHLNANPPAGSVFLGSTNAPVANSNGAQLHRISNPNFGPQVYSQHNVDTGAPTCSGWPRGERIYSRDITGAIDGGSSGSPIVNSSSLIVGQLSGTCGFNPSDPCASGPGEDNATVDGAFAFYYPSVQPFLNP